MEILDVLRVEVGGKGLPHMPTLDEVIGNTSYCLKEFADKMDSKIFGQELLTTNRNGRDGIQHMFKHMKANKYKNADIYAIGAKFEKSSQYYDVKFVDGRNLKFIEYKSWLPNNFGTQEHINQFIAYLREIESLDELNYVFNVSKADISVWKSKFKTIFKNNAKDIWNCNEGVFKKIIKIDESGNLEDWEDLYDFFNDKSLTNNNSIFNFIKAN
ncbi:MAG: hypothetical protein N4A72_13020 [Bacteroidales bacterium]|jgi:hypothetical protein|nr:hypothetical protein [Bacteroidales bacterium]